MLKYNYVYRLDHIKTGEFYFGSRTSKYHPTIDEYKGSMCTWKPDKTKLIKTILKDDFKTRKEAVLYEAELISKQIDDPLNRNYYIPPNNFHTTGKVTVKDKDGNTSQVKTTDPKYLSGELVSIMKGTVVVRDKKGKASRVLVTDPRFLSGELVSIHKGTMLVKDEDGNGFVVSTTDPRYLSGELIRPWTGRHHSEETKKKVRETWKRNKSGQGKSNPNYGTCWIYNEGLKRSTRIKKEDIDLWLDKGWIKGRKMKF